MGKKARNLKYCAVAGEILTGIAGFMIIVVMPLAVLVLV